MLLDHIRLCQANITLYAAPAPDVIEGVCYSLEKVGDVWVITLRGSETPGDWIRDFEAAPMWDEQLGYVHCGFMLGMRALLKVLQGTIPADALIAITGHSLGGARARILCALFIVNGWSVLQVVTFGSPKPAFVNLARIIQKAAVIPDGSNTPILGEHASYRNRNDPVPMAPIDLPKMDWEHTEAWVRVDAAPAATDFEPLRDHHIELYLRGLLALPPTLPATLAPP